MKNLLLCALSPLRWGKGRSWLLWLVLLGLGGPGAAWGQSTTATAPFVVRVTSPSQGGLGGGIVNLCAGSSAQLTATAVYPPLVTSGLGFDGSVLTVVVQSNGNILVGGDFTHYNGIVCNHIARLYSDGTLDTGFSANNGFDQSVSTILIQPNTGGKILVGGSFTNYTYNGTTVGCKYLARLLFSGSFDTSFGPGANATNGQFNARISTLGVQTTGNIVVGGSFTGYTNTSNVASVCNGIALLSAAGVITTSFGQSGSGFTGIVNGTTPYVSALVVQADDKIVVGGNFSSYLYQMGSNTATLSCTNLARLNTNGSPDTGFVSGATAGFFNSNTTSGVSTVRALALQANQQLVVGGHFDRYTYNGVTTTCNRIVRLNNNGSPDAAFAAQGGFSGVVISLAAQASNGGIVAGGLFTSYGGSGTSTNLARLTSTGALDTNFTTNLGFNAGVFALAIQPNGQILAGGLFTAYYYNNNSFIIRNYLARFTSTGTLNTTEVPELGAVYTWSDGVVGNPRFVSTGGLYTASATVGTQTAFSSPVSVQVRPALTAVPGPNRTVCPNSPGQLGAAPVAGYFYSWSPTTGLSNPYSANPTVTLPNTTGSAFTVSYTLTVTSSGGCGASTGTVNVTVNPAPAADAGGSISFCSGDGNQLGAAPVAGYTYSWSPTTGLSSATVANPTITLTNTTGTTTNTDYTLTVTNTATGCTGTDIASVEVTPPLIAVSGPPVTICSGSTGQLGAAPVAGVIYRWTPTFGLDDPDIADPTVTLTNFGSVADTVTYTVVAYYGETGCSRTDSVTVIVNPQPTASVATNPTTCAGVPVAIGAAAVAGYSYSWSPATGLSSATSANPTVTLPNATAAAITRRYLLTVTSGSNCTDTASVRVTVTPQPVATAGLAATICAGGATQLGAPAVAGYTYSWTPATGLSSATSANPTASPTATTTYTLTVANATGCTSTSPVTVTVNPQAAAPTGPAVSTCSGVGVAIGAALVVGYTYSWSPAAGLSSTTAANPTVTLLNTTGTPTTQLYTLTVTSAAGCTSIGTVAVTVNPRPLANAGASVTFCSGSTVQLGVAPVAGTIYFWNPTTGLSNPNIANPTLTLTNTASIASSQPYTLTATNLYSCTSTSFIAVTVNPLPVANAGPAVAFCAGGSATLGAAPVSGYSYQWSPATGLSSATAANPTVTLPNAGITALLQVYTLTVTSTSGCVSTSTVAVTVNPLPVANTGAAVAFCTGGSAQLGAAATTGYTYSWSPATGLSSTAVANPTVSLPNATGTAITQTYTLTVTNATSCVSTSTVVVTVDPLPVANAGPDVVFCSGNSATLGVAAVSGYVYSWSGSGLSSATAANPTITLTNSGVAAVIQSYTLTVTNTTTGCTASDAVQVTVNPLPVASAGAPAAICLGGSVPLGAVAGPGLTYAWSPAAGLSSATAANPVASPTSTTLYTLTVGDPATGCVSTATVTVTVNPLPVANAGAAATICAGGTATLGAAPVSGYSYQWSPATGLSSATAANPTLTLPNPTSTPTQNSYTLAVTNSQTGCTASGAVLVTVNPLPAITGFTATGPLGATITINGAGLLGVTAVTFAGVGGASVAATVFSSNALGTQLTVTVPPAAGDGLLTISTPCGTIQSSTIFRVIRNLVVQTPNAPAIQPGTYSSIIVTGTGIGTLHAGNVFVTDSVAVLDGGILRLGPFQLEGTGYFRLATGGTLSMGYPGGLALPGAVGAVDMTGTRRYSLDANYIYTGAVAQATGPGLPARVRNLTDSTRVGAALTLSVPTSVTQVLTMASATDFQLAGNALTLLSDARGTALVVNGPAGGKVAGATGTMQRFIDPTFNPRTGYRYYSPPVAGATVNTLVTPTFTPTVNPAYNMAANPLSVSPFPNVFRYEEARLGAVRPGLTALDRVFDNGLLSPAPNDPLVVGAGYAVNLHASDKVSFVGTFTTGDQTVNLTRTASPPANSIGTGWNLVGNPYPAPLNWDSVKVADRPNLDAALYTYESTGPNAGIYFSYVNGVGGSPVVASSKSFFVRVSRGHGTGSLTLRNSHRLTSYATPAPFARTQRQPNSSIVELELFQGGGGGGGRPPSIVYSDANAAAYRTTASAFSSDLDAYRIPATTGLNLSIGAATPEDELAIKAIPPFATQVLPLTVRVPQAGTYVLNAFNIQQLPPGVAAFLDDVVLGTSQNLSTQPTYSFTTAAAQAIAGRFFLRFGPTTPLPTRAWSATGDISLYPNPTHGPITVLIPGLAGATEVRATLLNQLGQVVYSQAVPLPPLGTRLLLDVLGLATGVYALRLQAGTTTAVRRLVVE